MKEYENISVADGVEVICVPATRFKTNETAICFSLELNGKTASCNSVLTHILSGCSAEYPDLTLLNRKLALLYGATLHRTVTKQAGNQIITLSISSLDDRFAIGDEVISRESLKLLLSLIFSPRVDENGYFFDEDIEREKRVVIQKLESEKSEKRIYALRRLEEEMFKGEPNAVNALGDIDGIKNVTKQELKTALDNLISNAKIQLITVGNGDSDYTAKTVKSFFDGVKRSYTGLKKPALVEKADKVNTVEERRSVKQGKLVLGYRAGIESDDERTTAMRIFSDVFGGGPYSKLFMNVREKLSLCYYCSARYVRSDSFISVQCGCEEENMDKAVNEIQAQLESIRNGDFKEEFDASVKGTCDSVSSVYDESEILLSWYISQITDSKPLSPNEYIEKFRSVSYGEIQNAARLISLDTVFKLTEAEK